MKDYDDTHEEEAEDQISQDDELNDEDLENAAGGLNDDLDPLLLNPDL